VEREFAGQVGVVTGAAGGLGRAVARMLAERGATVFLVDLDRERVEALAETLRKEGLATIAAAVDLGNEDELPELRAAIERHGDGRLDILVNNAGGWRHGRASEITMTDWDWTFRTNVTASFLTSRALMDLMVARRYGRIVNVASTDAHRAKPTLPHYAAAKAAVVSLTKSLAEELAPHQVLVNAVSPGAIATDVAKSQSWFHERVKSIPLGRAAEPEDIAEVILFLASPRNRFIVGETVMANGGLLMV
jgi:NAD(P)-dependent dehydrogenase (short-subunit alcohol dehydrogenase family)